MLKTTLILFFVTYFTVSEGVVRKGYPEYKFQEQLGGWMKLHEPATFKVADETCTQEGAVLVASQFDEVDATLIKIAKESNKSVDFLYINSLTLSGPTPPTEEVTEPAVETHIDCLVLSVNDSTKKNVDCSEEHAFICFAPMQDVDCGVDELGQTREGWPGYNRCSDIEGWVKVHPGPTDYDDAKKTCNEEGGELIDLKDEKFKKIALKFIQANSTDENPLLIFGKTKVAHPQGGFVIIDGKKKFVKDLKPDCALLYPNGTLVTPVDCETKVGFICYVPYPTALTCDNDYTLENSTERCYKIHSIGKTWSDARQHCQDDGGDLAVIRSEEVANKLSDMYVNYDGYFETYHPWALFVGILEKTVGSWTTIKDETLEEAGYNVWAAGNPANRQSENPAYKGVRQTCGCMNMQGKYVDSWCEMKHAYVCEKNSTLVTVSGLLFHYYLNKEL